MEGTYLKKSKEIVNQALYIYTVVVYVPEFKMPVLCLIILRFFSSFYVIAPLTMHFQLKLKKESMKEYVSVLVNDFRFLALTSLSNIGWMMKATASCLNRHMY